MNMNILITGGAGFIGYYCVEWITQQGHRAMVYDVAPYRGEKAMNCPGSVLERQKIAAAVEASDGVMHLAGLLGTAERIGDAAFGTEVNVQGSINVFDACRRYEKRCVYIAVGNHFMNNTYAITKTTAERFALMYNKEFGTQIAVVRALNAYGPHQKAGPIRKVIPTFCLAAIRNQPVEVYGDGEQVMDFIYAADVAEILLRALVGDHGVYDGIIEAGSGKRTTVNYIAEQVVRIADSKSIITHLPMRPGEPPRSIVLGDTATLKPLGVDPERLTSLETGLTATIEYYRTIAKATR